MNEFKEVEHMDPKMKTALPQQDADGAPPMPLPPTGDTSEVVAVARRRTFTKAYMRRIVHEANACTEPGGIGALLRREGLYSSHLSKWRIEVAALDAADSHGKPRGPKPDAAKAVDRRVAQLEAENSKLRKKLGRAEQIIDVQKKLCDLLGLPTAEEVP